jgi:hypothetical protein
MSVDERIGKCAHGMDKFSSMINRMHMELGSKPIVTIIVAWGAGF